VVGDSKYGTIDNFLACHDLGVQAHLPDLGEISTKRTEKLKIFSEDRFDYDSESDTYRCPAGQRLKPKSLHIHRQSRDYAAPKKICAACDLREQCTKNKSGRTIKRHLRQEELDRMREASRSAKAKRDIKMRQHLMERSYARGTRYGFDRARWRGLWRADTEVLILAVQNIQILLRYGSYLKIVHHDRSRSKGHSMGCNVFFRFDKLVTCTGQTVLFGFTPSLSIVET
jgi:hypothetical protein